MPQPPEYVRVFNFTDFSTVSPADQQPGNQLDAEFNAIKNTADQVRTNLGKIQSDDGTLANGIVRSANLSSEFIVGFDAPTEWEPDTDYLATSAVFHSAILYKAKEAHTSGATFDEENWEVIADFAELTVEASHWANYPVDQLVPEGDGIDDFSALHHATKASESANALNMPIIQAGDAGTILQVNSDEDGHSRVPLPSGRRNALINGGFDVWQRGESFNVSGTDYTADRWQCGSSGATVSVTQEDFTLGQTAVPGEPKHYLHLDVTQGNDFCAIRQLVEDVRTFAGQTVTLSFWAQGVNPGGGHIDARVTQKFGSGASASAQVIVVTTPIALTGSWARHAITLDVPSISGKTIDGDGYVEIDLEQPGDDASTAAWEMDLAQCQLEAGSIATPFDKRPIGEELALCQRYYRTAYYDLRYNDTSQAPGGEIERTLGLGTPMRAQAAVTASVSTGGNVTFNSATHYNNNASLVIKATASAAYQRWVTGTFTLDSEL